MNFYILDTRNAWHAAAIKTARDRGYYSERLRSGGEAIGKQGYGFIRPHADPEVLKANWGDYVAMADSLTMIQDRAQVEVYENKTEQFARWGHLMPPTVRFTDRTEALMWLVERFDKAQHTHPWLVSKANEGASSKNVRILRNLAQAVEHTRAAFEGGIEVDCCSGGAKVKQQGYVLFQQYVTHDTTWRVNAIGNARAMFRRFNGPTGFTAVTGNTEPVKELDETSTAVLEFANKVFAELGTKWCALDILMLQGNCYLLETSLAWPWPSPGDCDNAPIFGTKRLWRDLWHALFDEIEAGTW